MIVVTKSLDAFMVYVPLGLFLAVLTANTKLSLVRGFSPQSMHGRISTLGRRTGNAHRRFSLNMSDGPRHVVVVGGGVQGTSVAYHLKKSPVLPPGSTVSILEAVAPASAASGKGGGFMARAWGDGSSTQQLHHVAFDMYEDLCRDLDVQSYRKLPVLSVSPGKGGVNKAKKSNLNQFLPKWLDGNVGRIQCMGTGDDTAQITPKEFVEKMISSEKIDVVLGVGVGVATEPTEDGGSKIAGVKYTKTSGDEEVLPCDTVVISAGPWSCMVEDWFGAEAIEAPMEGIKSTSIVWKSPDDNKVDATALFCGEDDRFGTHLEVYPRPDGSIYLCGIGGSDYVQKEELMRGAYRTECNANESRVAAASGAFQEMSAAYRGGELDRVQACMRPCPPDAKPYMGAIPGFEGAYINAGHNCWGIAWAPACGIAMSELILEGKSSSVNLAPFNPSRFTEASGRGGRGRKRGTASVGEQW